MAYLRQDQAPSAQPLRKGAFRTRNRSPCLITITVKDIRPCDREAFLPGRRRQGRGGARTPAALRAPPHPWPNRLEITQAELAVDFFRHRDRVGGEILELDHRQPVLAQS